MIKRRDPLPFSTPKSVLRENMDPAVFTLLPRGARTITPRANEGAAAVVRIRWEVSRGEDRNGRDRLVTTCERVAAIQFLAGVPLLSVDLRRNRGGVDACGVVGGGAESRRAVALGIPTGAALVAGGAPPPVRREQCGKLTFPHFLFLANCCGRRALGMVCGAGHYHCSSWNMLM